MVSGEATAAQITEARPHLRNCSACKATLRGLHQSHRPLKAILPVGLVSVGAKLAGLVERLLPGLGGGDAGGAAAGGAGLLGIGGAKLAGLLAVGAAATGGGLVMAQDAHRNAGHQGSPAGTIRAAPARAGSPVAGAVQARPAAAARAAPAKITARRRGQPVVLRGSAKRRIEFAPRGSDLTSTPRVPTTPRAVRATAPRPVPAGSDSTRGEFAPQP
jgi:hypothetical protein